MCFKNTPTTFGLITKFCHWTLVILVTAQFLFMLKKNSLPENAPEAMSYILWHKSVGVLVGGLALFMLIWQQFNTRPTLNMLKLWERILARTVHYTLYALLIIMPIAGVAMSQAAGYGAKVFGLELPTFIEKNPELAKQIAESHEIAGFVLLIVIGLHIIGALKHHYIDKNSVLVRMLPHGRGE